MSASVSARVISNTLAARYGRNWRGVFGDAVLDALVDAELYSLLLGQLTWCKSVADVLQAREYVAEVRRVLLNE